jgi:hypothetical protein
LLPELSREQQAEFLANPVEFFLNANEAQSDAIMREIEGRQGSVRPKPAAQNAVATAFSEKPSRAKKPRAEGESQRELLLPIAGGGGQRPRGRKSKRLDAKPGEILSTSERVRFPYASQSHLLEAHREKLDAKLLKNLARPERFELPTPRFVV